MVALFAMMTLGQDPERDAAIARADAAVRAAAPLAAQDPDRPAFHYRAPAQWLNDPNGPILYKGWYDVFYQLTPDRDGSGIKHWGHARSRDLVHWEDLPIALSPVAGEDSVGSGSVFPGPGGKPIAFYTSIGSGREPEQWIATPEDDDLVRWRRDPVRITQAIHGGRPLAEWRDPFLFEDFGLTFMVAGGGRDGRGVVALYKATDPDLRHWQYLGDVFTHPDANVRNLECPNLFPLDGKWVLLVSVWPRIEAFVGELRNTTFVAERRTVLAEGSYASQIFQGTPDRTVQLAWVPTEGHKGWNGYLTLPSELHVAKDGTLLRTPVKELAKLRGRETKLGDFDLEGERTLPSGDSLEIEAMLEPKGAKTVGLRLFSGAIRVAFEPAAGHLTVGGHTASVPADKPLRLRVFLDRTSVDVYAADGAATFAERIDHVAGREHVLFAEGGKTRVRGLVVRELTLGKPR